MKTNQRRKGTKNILIQVHSFILNLVLCLGLYSAHVPLSYATDSGSNLDALTQNVGNSGAKESDMTASGDAPAPATAATKDSISNTNSGTKIKGKDIDPRSKMLLGNIALFASTMAAPILIKQCPNAASVWIYGASAALYLANEIGLFTRFKNASDAEMAAYLGRGDEDKQIISLEAAAKQTEKAQKAAKRRAMIAKIAAAGFAAATVMALVESTEFYTGTGCEGGSDVDNSFDRDLRNQQFDIDFNPTMMAMENTKAEAILDFSGFIDSSRLNTQADNFDFMVSYQEQNDFFSGKTQSISIDEYHKRKQLISGDINRIQGLKSAFILLTKVTAELLTTEARADDSAQTSQETADSKNNQSTATGNDSSNSTTQKKQKTGINWTGSGVKAITGMLGVAAGVIFGEKIGIEQSKLVKLPYTRAALFGGMGVFAIGAAKESDEAAKKLGERSTEYHKLADSLRSQVKRSASTEKSPYAQTISATGSGESGSNGNDGNGDMCITGKATTSISVDPNCTCATADSCKKTNLPDISKMPKFAGQSLLSDSLKSLKSAGDSVYAGRLKGAQAGAFNLGKNAARISRLRDALVKKINADSVAAGGKGNYDLNALQNKINGRLLKQVNEGFNKLTPSQQASLASFAPALSDSKSTASKDKKKKSSGSAAVGGTGKIAAGSGGPKTNSGSGFNFNFDEENEDTKTDPEAEALAKAMAQEDDNYLIEGDINDDRNKDIFKIITGRYLKSAYPVIFEEAQ